MAEIYQCGNFGAKFCDECGTKLEWPKEKVAKVKVVKNKKAKRIVKLDVDPLAVDDLYESSLGLSVGIFFLGAGGLIITPIIWYQRYVIGKWIRNLMNPDSVPDLVATDRMIRRTKTIRSSCAVICALNILAFISAYPAMLTAWSPIRSMFPAILNKALMVTASFSDMSNSIMCEM